MPVKKMMITTDPAYDPMKHQAELTVILWPGDKAEIFTSRGQSVILDAEQFTAFFTKCQQAMAVPPSGSD